MTKFEKVAKLAHNTKYYHKLADRIEDLNDKEYHLLMGPDRPLLPFYSTGYIYKKKIRYRTIQLISNLQIAKIQRNTIVETLQSIKFKRVDKFNKYLTIGFVEEMIRLKYEKSYPNDLDKDDYIDDIAERYAIPKYKLGSTMTLIINNIKKGYDTYNLLDYFDWFELFQYKYKDNEKQLIKDFNDNKLNDVEEEIYRQLYNI